jgi:hypothetical protein
VYHKFLSQVFRNVTVGKAFAAVRIKGAVGRGGFVRDILYENVRAKSVLAAVWVDMDYDSTATSHLQKCTPEPGCLPMFDNISVSDLHVERSGRDPAVWGSNKLDGAAFTLIGLDRSPTTALRLTNVTVTQFSNAEECTNTAVITINVSPKLIGNAAANCTVKTDDDQRCKISRFVAPPFTPSWVDWLVVVAMPNPPIWYNDSERQWLAETVDPDLIDWAFGDQWNRGDYFRASGVAISSEGESEYEEAYQFNDQNVPLYFNGSGISIDEYGAPVRYAGYPPGDTYFMTLNGPRWREEIVQGNVRSAGYYNDALSQDNIGSVLNKAAANFDDSTNSRFREWLFLRCSCPDIDCSTVVPLMSVLADPGFNIRTHLAAERAKGKSRWNATLACSTCEFDTACCAGSETDELQRLVTEPVIHEYIRASYVFDLWNWQEVINATKKSARASLRPAPLGWGNQWGLGGVYPMSMMMSQVSDAVWIESSLLGLPTASGFKHAWTTLNYKLGHASGNYKKQIFVVLYPGQRRDGSLVYAEAAANGGLFESQWSCSWVPSSAKASPSQFYGDPNGYCAAHVEFSRFLSAQPHLFTDRTRVTEVGLLFSLPTILWRRFSSLTFGRVSDIPADLPMINVVGGIARLMEDHKILYEAMILGLPGLFEDGEQTARLSRYKTVVLPAVDAISDHHVQLLFSYVRAGGHLVLVDAINGVGTLDEELVPRANGPAFAPLLKDHGSGKLSEISLATMMAYLAGSGTAQEQVLVETIRVPQPLLTVTSWSPGHLPASSNTLVWANVFRHAAGPTTSVTLVDYLYDPSCNIGDHAKCRKNLTLSIRVPHAQLNSVSARYYSPDFGMADLVTVSGANGYVNVTVPILSYFGAVMLTSSEAEQTCLSAAGQARKLVQRCTIAARVLMPSHSSLNHEIQRLSAQALQVLDSVQGQTAMSSCTGSVETQLVAISAQLRLALTNVSTAVSVTSAQQLAALEKDTQAVVKLNAGSVLAGWKTLFGNSTYGSGSSGYGWESNVLQPPSTDIAPQSSPCPGPLLCTYVYGYTTCDPVCSGEDATPPIKNGTLIIDLKPGKYIISTLVAKWGPATEMNTAITYVSTPRDAAIGRRLPHNGAPQLRSLEHTVRAGESNVRVTFGGSNVGTRWRHSLDDTHPQAGIVNSMGQWAGVGWLVNAVIVHQATTKNLPPPLVADLAQHRGLRAAAVGDWALLGPLEDENSTGLTRALGPETDGNLSRSWANINGHTVGWTHCSANTSCRWWGQAVDIGATLDATGSAAFLQTHVHVAAPTQVVLVGSTSGTGVFYLNGKTVLTDQSYVGLEEGECTAIVQLEAGWNRLAVKSLWHWGLGPNSVAVGWSSYVALYEKKGRKPLVDGEAQISACGEQKLGGWGC